LINLRSVDATDHSIKQSTTCWMFWYNTGSLCDLPCISRRSFRRL